MWIIMNIKHLIIASLLLAILTIGAASANEVDEALAVDDDGVEEVSTTIDETESIDAPVSEEIISDSENEDDPFDGLTKDDFTVEIKSKVNVSNEDEYVISYTCPKNVSNGSYIDVWVGDEAEFYPSHFSTSQENDEPIKLKVEDLGLAPFREQELVVYYCLSDEVKMEIASGTVYIVKIFDKDDFNEIIYEDNQVITSRRDNEILQISPLVDGTLIVTTDKGHKYEEKLEAFWYTYVFIETLNITENGTYEINVKFIPENGTEVDVATYNITVDIDWNAPYDPLLDLKYEVNLLDKSSEIVEIDDEIPFIGKLTITIDDKQYYSKTLAKKDEKYEIMILDLNSLDVLPGKHNVTVEYVSEDGEKHSIRDVVKFYEGNTVIIPDYMSVGEEKFIYVYCNETTGKAEVYLDNDDTESELFATENITNGMAKIPLGSLSNGYYNFKVIVISNSCPGGDEFENQLVVDYNSGLFTFDVTPKEVTFGKNALINFTGPFDEGDGVKIYVDDILIKTLYGFDSLVEIGAGLEVGQHKIGVAYYGGDEFYSNSIWITVKEAPIPVDSGLELLIDDVVEGTNVTIVVKTNSSFNGSVDVVIGNQTIPVAVSAGEGSASVSLKANTYEAKAIFKATDLFEAKNVTKTFNVTAKSPSGNESGANDSNKKPVTPPKADKITLTLKKVKVKKSAKKLVLQATLKINGKKAKKGTKVIFKFNGKKYSAKINAKGVAKVTIKKKVLKKLKAGKKVKYQVSYGKIVKKLTVKVKK